MAPKRAASKALPSARDRATEHPLTRTIASAKCGGAGGATSFVGIYDGGGDSGDALVLHCPIDPLDRRCTRKDMYGKERICIAALFGKV